MKPRIQFLLLMIGLILSSCEKNEAEPEIRELFGKWTWVASCGGISGACSYPDKENYKSLQILNDKFTEKTNGKITVDMSYDITNTSISGTNHPYEVNYELTLEDGSVLDMTLIKNKNKLMIWNNIYLDYYEGR